MMENQVTSIEQSRRLLELGVPAGKSGMLWQRFVGFPKFEVSDKDSVWYLVLVPYYDIRYEYIPAFTVADLLGMLPTIISYKDRLYYLSVCISGYDCSVEYILHDCVEGVAYIGELNTMINSLFNAIEWLSDNGINIKL